ncbi:MAG: TetR/AcrR family transcriptional regulator [Jatrophihabitans sp.]
MSAADTARLPRGRHNLSRAEVAAAQRTRILTAMAEVMAVRGYVDTPVAAVLERAGVSRETFYQLFDSKQDCFIAALSDAIDDLAVGIQALVAQHPGPPIDTFDRLIGEYLSVLGTNPATARLFLIETYAAGPDAMNRRLDLHGQFVEGLASLFGVTTEQGRFACGALVATVISLATASFIRGDEARLSEIRGPLVEMARTLTAA